MQNIILSLIFCEKFHYDRLKNDRAWRRLRPSPVPTTSTGTPTSTRFQTVGRHVVGPSPSALNDIRELAADVNTNTYTFRLYM